MRTRFALVVGLLVCYAGVASAQVRQEWVARHDGPQSQEDGARDIALDALGNIYVTGAICTYYDYLGQYSGGCIDSGWETIKYDADGNKLWSAYYHDLWTFWLNSAGVVAVDNAGNVYVTGSICVAAAWDEISGFCWETEYTTIKYDTNGNQRWVALYGGPVDDWNFSGAVAIVTDRAGNVYVTGSSLGVDGSYAYATIKYDTNGSQAWVARYDGLANGDDGGAAIALDGAGNVYVTGHSHGTGPLDTATIKYDDRGNQIWVARSAVAAGVAIVLDDPGNVYVTGAATVKYDGDGHELWVARYSGPGIVSANALTVDAAGNVYVTGAGQGVGTSTDYATIKFNAAGNELWVARYNGPGDGYDWAGAIAVDASRNVYVTGQSDGTVTGPDYATIKYDSDGNELWVARYNGTGNGSDAAAAIVVDDATSNVYVTGYSWGTDTKSDYATIRYSQTPPKATPTVTMTGGTFAYDGSPHQASATARGIDGLPVAGTFAFDYTPGGAAAPTAPGTYLVTVTFTSADPNYLDGASNGTLTIAPVVMPAPGPTSPVSPVGSIADSTPTFSWSAVGAATYYALSVTDANMAAPILMWYTPPLAGCDSGVGTCTVAAPRALLAGLVTWKVITWNPSGYGPWSSTATAVVDLADASVPSPVLVGPSGPIPTRTPTYTWTPVTGAIWYQLSVSVKDMMGVVVAVREVWATPAQACVPSSCAVTPNLLLPAGRTEWKVKAWRTAGGGSWSAVATFYTADVAPGKATLVSPVTPVTTATPSFTWNAVLDTSYYLLRLTDRDNMSVDLWYRPGDAGCPFGTGLCAVSPGVSIKAGSASWKVLTWNASGYGPWSDTRDFLVEIPALLAFEMTGTVTDDDGHPVADANLDFDYLPSDVPGTYFAHVSGVTDGTGFYRIDFTAVSGAMHGPPGTNDAIAFGGLSKSGYDGDFHYILGTTHGVSQNFQLHRIKRMTAGESTVVTVAPDDSICNNNIQDLHPWPQEFVCRSVRVVATTDGIMTLEALSTEGGARPGLAVETVGDGPEPFGTPILGNPTSIQVTAGTEVLVNVEIIWGSTASQSFTLTTSMAPQ